MASVWRSLMGVTGRTQHEHIVDGTGGQGREVDSAHWRRIKEDVLACALPDRLQIN